MWRMRAAESRSRKLRFKSFCCVVVNRALHFYVRIQRRYVWNKNNFSVNLTSQLSQVSWRIFQCERDDLMFWGKLKSFTEVVHGLPQPKTSKTIDLGSNQGRFNITGLQMSSMMTKSPMRSAVHGLTLTVWVCSTDVKQCKSASFWLSSSENRRIHTECPKKNGI